MHWQARPVICQFALMPVNFRYAECRQQQSIALDNSSHAVRSNIKHLERGYKPRPT